MRVPLLREPSSELSVRDRERDQLVPPVSHELPVSMVCKQPRQIALVRFNALLDEFWIPLSDDSLNLGLASL